MTDTAENTNRKRTTVTIIILIIAVSIVLTACVLPGHLYDIRLFFYSTAGDELSNKKYAAVSGLERGDYTRSGNYSVERSDEYEWFDYLKVKSSDRSDIKYYVEFQVFNSSIDAKAYFMNKHSEYVEFDDKDTNWFIAKQPNTYDADYKMIYYLEDNVVLSAVVWYMYYGTWGEGEEHTQSTLPVGLSEYVIDNAADLRKFVLTEVLA